MRIAQIAPLFESVPPKLDRGTKRAGTALLGAIPGRLRNHAQAAVERLNG
jgi:hypothetical protein